MILGYSPLRRYVTEHPALLMVHPAHHRPSSYNRFLLHYIRPTGKLLVFPQPARINVKSCLRASAERLLDLLAEYNVQILEELERRVDFLGLAESAPGVAVHVARGEGIGQFVSTNLQR